MYRGMTDTMGHFDSGACGACKGQENARRAAYQLVSGQQGGGAFLSGPLLLTHSGDQGGGYTGTNDYHCPGCQKRFSIVTSLMQHTENRPECSQRGQHVNLRLGHSSSHSGGGQPQRMKFCHGTTWRNARNIEHAGFVPSQSGCLGQGIYVAREDKARRFAHQGAVETGDEYGGLVHLVVTVANPKYVLSNDYHWQSEGYDACRAERTTASTNMEWCIRDAHQIEVTGVEKVWVY